MDFWKNNFKDFMILNKDKQPTHKFFNPKNYYDIENEENAAVILPKPVIVIDIDDRVEASYFNKILETEYNHLNYISVKTDRGFHYYFKSLKSIKNITKQKNPFGLTVDIKCWNNENTTMTIIKKDDSFREIVKECPVKALSEIPKEFLTYQNLINTKSGIRSRSGDGRRDILFEKIKPLVHNNFNKEEIQHILHLINDNFFDESIEDKEFNSTLFNDDSIFDEVDSSNWFSENRFNHTNFALDLHKKYSGYNYNDQYWFYDDSEKIYINKELDLFRAMNTMYLSIKDNQRKEVQKLLKALPKKYDNDLIHDSSFINCKNGIYNYKTDTFTHHSRSYFLQTKINTNYDPLADTSEVDEYLLDLFSGDKQVVELIEQILGYIIYPDVTFQAAFIFLGEGSNGKSLFVRFIAEMLGDKNISAIGFEKLGDRFYTANLQGKMLNIGEEIPYRKNDEPQMVKKIISGEKVEVERKHQAPFMFENKAKFIFTCNKLPPTTDHSYGYFRRWKIIPFLKTYTSNSLPYDIKEKLFTEKNKSALLNIAIRGLKKLMTDKIFLNPELVKKITEDYKRQTNSTYWWFTEYVKDVKEIEGCDVLDLYTSDYKIRMTQSNKKAVGLDNFKKDFEWVLSEHGYEVKLTDVNKQKKLLIYKINKKEL